MIDNMENLDDMIVVKIDSLLSRGTMLELVDIEVSKGSVEVLDDKCISQLDVIIGYYPLKRWNNARIALEGTEPLILKIGDMLLQEGLATTEEVFDIRSTLAILGGSSGHERTIQVIETLQDHELNMLICWIYATSILQFNSTSVISVGVRAIAGEYRKSESMQMKVKDIIGAYQLEHQYRGEGLIDIDVTVIPAWYWIHQLKEDRKQYNLVLKKEV